jgi:hypothetical protein
VALTIQIIFIIIIVHVVVAVDTLISPLEKEIEYTYLLVVLDASAIVGQYTRITGIRLFSRARE